MPTKIVGWNALSEAQLQEERDLWAQQQQQFLQQWSNGSNDINVAIDNWNKATNPYYGKIKDEWADSPANLQASPNPRENIIIPQFTSKYAGQTHELFGENVANQALALKQGTAPSGAAETYGQVTNPETVPDSYLHQPIVEVEKEGGLAGWMETYWPKITMA